MTPKQAEYVRHRAAGLGQERAAIAAGYAESSAKVSASRMERMPEIRAAIDEARKAIDEARKATGSGAEAPQEFEGAEDYLLAVVKGQVPPDPVRVGAARALLPFMKARQRAPMKSSTPKQLAKREEQAGEKEMLDAWAAKAAAVRARIKRIA